MKRIWKDALVACVICGVAGETLYWGVLLYQQQNYLGAAFVFGVLLGLVMLIGPAAERARRSIQRRRSVAGMPFAALFESVAPTLRGHALDNRRGLDQRVSVKVDGIKVVVDLAELWQLLLDEKANDRRNCLSWTRCVLQQGMEANQWKAYRQILIETGAVVEVGTGALRLVVAPWEVVERARSRYGRRVFWQFLSVKLR